MIDWFGRRRRERQAEAMEVELRKRIDALNEERIELARRGQTLLDEVDKLREQLEIRKRVAGTASKRFDRVLHEARGLNLSESGRAFRDGELWHLAHDRRFVSLLALVDDLKSDLNEEAVKYSRLELERSMDAGGARALSELMDRLREIAEKVEQEETEGTERK